MAYNCNAYCNDSLGTYLPNECDETLGAGMSAILILECNHQISDPSNATQVNAAIANGTAYLIRGVSMTLEAPTALTQDATTACSTPSVVTYDRTGLYTDFNVNPTNVDFYQGIFPGRSFGGIISYLCNANSSDLNYVLWIDAQVKFQGGLASPANLAGNEALRFAATVAWRSKLDPSMHVAPPGVF